MAVIYEPDNLIKKGFLEAFKEICADIINNRWLTYQLFKRNFLSLYRQSFMGVMWALIVPVASVCTFVILGASGIIKIGNTGMPYPVYAVLGIAFWQLFSMGIITCTNALYQIGPVISRINFSKKSVIIASFGQAVVSFAAQIGLIALIFAYYHQSPSILALFLPILLLPLVLLTVGLGFILSLLNAVVKDTSNLVSVSMTFFLLLTPVLYTKPTSGLLAQVTRYNPVYYLISSLRELVITGTIVETQGLAISIIVSVIVFFIGVIVFHLAEPRIAERV